MTKDDGNENQNKFHFTKHVRWPLNNVFCYLFKKFLRSDWPTFPDYFQLTSKQLPNLQDTCIVGRLASHNRFFTAQAKGAKMDEIRCETLNEEEIAQLLNDKSDNTQKATKGNCLIFQAYLQDKNIRTGATA